MSTVRHYKPRSLLRDHDFGLLFLGESVSKLGSAATVVALPLIAVTTLHSSTAAVGWLGVAGWLPWLLVSLPAGAWVDRMGRRAVMIWSDLIAAALLLSVPVAAWFGLLTVGHLLIAAFGAGTCAVFFKPAYRAFMRVVVPSDRLVDGNGLMSMSEGFAEVSGPGIAGLMAQTMGAVAALAADAGSFLASAVCLWRIRAREVPDAAPRSNAGLLGQIREGLRFVARDPYLRPISLFMAAGNLLLAVIQILAVVFLLRDVGVSPGTAGVLLASMGVGGIVGAQLMPRLVHRIGDAWALLLAEAVTAPFALLLPLTTHGWRLGLFATGMVIAMAGVVGGSVAARTFIQRYVPDHLIGRVSSTMSFVIFGAGAVGAGLAGWAGTVFGVRPTLWAACALLPATVLPLVLSPIARRRDLPGAVRA